MKILFRADSSLRIGTGHVVRCLSLAEVLRKKGVTVSFACRELPGHVSAQIEKAGFSLHLLSGETLDWQADAMATLAVLEKLGGVDWLVVDHYGLDARWERMAGAKAASVLAIDDLADREHDCTLLLDQNFFVDAQARYKSRVSTQCRQLLGPRYALLAEKFQSLAAPRPRSGAIRKLLVFFGGSDPGNETTKALEAVKSLAREDWHVDIVVGASNPNQRAIRKLAETLPSAKCHVQIDYMAELMLAADVAIGAGGTTTWERCRTGLPCLTISIAANQVEPSRNLATGGYTLYLGESASVTTAQLAQALVKLEAAPELLREYSARGLTLVDGQGIRRLVRRLLPNAVTVRAARPEECDTVFAWRNAEENRKFFFEPRALSLDEHRAWYAKTLADPGRALLVGSVDGDPVGVLRFDFSGSVATVSVYLVPGHSGRGLGTSLLEAGTVWIRKTRPDTRELRAEVRTENAPSKAAFRAAGYQDAGLTNGINLFLLKAGLLP